MATGRLAAAAQLAATTNTTVYTVPTGYYAVANVSFTNTGTSSVTVRLAMATSASPSSAEWIEYDTVIVGKGVFERTGLVLQAGLNLVAYSNTGSAVNVTVYGFETATT
jgi:hypothetical protein